ncbi:peptidoglycan-binding protein [Streptomyces bambusae]|uniref:peptidoglycan-binding domain-containing protein n=1 Tax=Streptomyces bambusae TaxID=1550616 RepID=UPI001CFDD9F7|nr:peptidoglycan-binding domain-containing protein [Streptomyces bambusae]MCB5167005.1 peptidoglycan-binding protein [Streptomyces bambusae]
MRKKVISLLSVFGTAAGLLMVSAGPAAASPACTMHGFIGAYQGTIVDIPIASGGTHCHLQQGYANEAVRVLQKSIVRCYGISIQTDGQFGPRTKAALIEVQRRERINQDGGYGPQTRDAMYHTVAAWEEQQPIGCRRLNRP